MEENKEKPGYITRQITQLPEKIAALESALNHFKSLDKELTDQIAMFPEKIAELESVRDYFKLLAKGLAELFTMIGAFAENAREGCVLVMDNKLVWINKAARELSGYLDADLVGRPIAEFVLPDIRDKMAARVNMTMAGAQLTFPQEWQILKCDRTPLWVNVFAYRVPYLAKSAIIVFFYDITEEKRNMEDQKMSAEMMDSLNDVVFLMDLKGKLVYVNKTACDLSGYSKDELLKMNILDLTAPELRKRFDIRMKQFSIHKEARYTSIAVKKDGTRFPAELMGKVIMYNGKQHLLCVATVLKTIAESEIDKMYFADNK